MQKTPKMFWVLRAAFKPEGNGHFWAVVVYTFPRYRCFRGVRFHMSSHPQMTNRAHSILARFPLKKKSSWISQYQRLLRWNDGGPGSPCSSWCCPYIAAKSEQPGGAPPDPPPPPYPSHISTYSAHCTDLCPLWLLTTITNQSGYCSLFSHLPHF